MYTTRGFDAFRSGGIGTCHSPGSEILEKDEVPGSIPGVGSGMRWRGASRTTIDVRGNAALATALRRTAAVMTPALLRRDPIPRRIPDNRSARRESTSDPVAAKAQARHALALTAHAVRIACGNCLVPAAPTSYRLLLRRFG